MAIHPLFHSSHSRSICHSSKPFIFRHYRDKYRLWVRKNKPDWIIREHNAVDAHFETVMGEPMLKLTYGKQFVMVSLAELENM